MTSLSNSPKSHFENNTLMKTVYANIIAAGISGFFTDVFFHPLETLKIRMQISNKFLKVSVLHNIFRGISAQALLAAPSGSVFFMSYEGTKYIIDSCTTNLSLTQKSMLASCVAEIAKATFNNPIKLIKEQIQIGQQEKIKHTFKYILQTQGALGFYRGFWSSLVRQIPYGLLQMPTYEVSLHI
jgi:solute carrier family 25 S-adenosylmethionine transporter 26